MTEPLEQVKPTTGVHVRRAVLTFVGVTVAGGGVVATGALLLAGGHPVLALVGVLLCGVVIGLLIRDSNRR